MKRFGDQFQNPGEETERQEEMDLPTERRRGMEVQELSEELGDKAGPFIPNQ